MKKLLLMFGAIALSSGLALAQCANSGVQFGSGTAPSPGNSAQLTTCAFAGEYSTITGVIAGNTYTVSYTGGASNYVTIYNSAFTPIFWGVSPVNFTVPANGTYYSQSNLNDGLCGTENACRTVLWTNTTPPPPCPIEASPYLNDVEAFPVLTNIGTTNCWVESHTGSVFDWNVTATNTSSFGTGAESANSGTHFFYTEASGALVGDVANLTSPEIDLTGLTNPMLSFYYHMFGAQIGTLEAQVSDDNGITWNTVATLTGAQQSAQLDPFMVSETVLTGYSGVIKLRFRAVSGGSFEGDISLDDIAIVEAPTCPNPTNLALTGSDFTSATFSWNPGLSETEWAMEYGAPGFTPGTGTSSIVTNNINETVTGIPTGAFYEMYVRAACSPGDTSNYVGPVSFNTFNQGLYMDADNACGPGFIDISSTGTGLGLGDDGTAGVTMPFSLLYQGSLVNLLTISNNGAIAFGSLTAGINLGGTVGAGTPNGIYPFWDDLDSESGDVYYETVGTAPNQTFIVQWNQRPHFSGIIGQDVTFQIQMEEATGEIYFVYTDVVFGGSQAYADYAANAGIGAAGPSQDIAISSYDPTYLTDNSCVHFFYTDCPNPTSFTLVYVNPDNAGITWNAGLASEVNWTVIYGPAGFDPLTSGTTINTGSNVAVLTGLNDITEYDVYIYADCDPGVLQSTGGLVGTFVTPPNCSDITGLGASTSVDSLFSSWSWTESSGVGTYPSTGFNLMYGSLGFDLYSGTMVAADNNYTDTTFDASFMAGGVYELYVQAVCGSDTSNYVGPVTFTMPLTNDSTCFAQAFPVDGVTYYFDNTGATIDANENTIAPPTTGYNEVDGWGNSNINFTTWFTFVAPASGSIYVSGKDAGFDGQIAIYDATDCGDFSTYTLVAANDDAIDFTSAAPYFSVCGLTPGNTYYMMHDSWSSFTTGIYSLNVREIVVEAGVTTGLIEACTGDVVDLFNGMSGQDAGGVWYEAIPTASFSGSTFPTAGLAYQTFDFEYFVTDGCAVDSAMQQVQIFAPSSAGNDGSLTACQNEPINLLSGLSGTVDLGGTWYNPSNIAIAGPAITTSSLGGLYNYDYITGNGVCPDDTANIVVNVSISCDFLNTQELFFGDMSVFPNPSTGIVNITNFGSSEVFSYELTDLKGRVISGQESAINGSATTEIDLGGLETGIYIIEVYNDSARTTFRIVLQ